MTIGSKLKVWTGTAHKTSGGLTKKDLMLNKHGKVVSIKQHKAGMKNSKNLGAHLQKAKPKRVSTRATATRLEKGKGLLDILGLGLPKPKAKRATKPKAKKTIGRGAYASAGGKVKKTLVRPRKITGKGFFDDLASGIQHGLETATKLAPLVATMV